MDELVKLNSRPEFREYMSVEEDERKIHNSLLQSSYNEGKTDGKLEGIKEGIKEEKINLAKKLLSFGMNIKNISELTELNENEVKKLKNTDCL